MLAAAETLLGLFTAQRWVGTLPNCGRVEWEVKVFFEALGGSARRPARTGSTIRRDQYRGKEIPQLWLDCGWTREKWE